MRAGSQAEPVFHGLDRPGLELIKNYCRLARAARYPRRFILFNCFIRAVARRWKAERKRVGYMHQIKASAGSGKTTALTSKYLQLMTGCQAGAPRQGACQKKPFTGAESVRDIAAITFTNAAVNEIQERVISTLKKIALNLKEAEGLDKVRARACLEALLDDMDQLNVRTIDSLLHQITRAASLSLGLNPDFDPVFDTSEALKPYMDEFVQEAFLGDEEKRRLISGAVDKFLRFEAGREGKAEPLFMGKSLGKELEKLFEDSLLSVDEPPCADTETVEKRLLEYQEKACEAAGDLKSYIEGLQNGKRAGFDLFKSAYRELVLALAEGREPGKDCASSGPIGAQLNKRYCKKDFADSLQTDLHDRMMENYINFRACQEHIKFASVRELAAVITGNYLKDISRAKALPSVSIPLLAQKALSADEGVCDALCRLGSRLTHFMIDEFQDTSMAQWKGLRPLIEEALSRNGGLTWVGDIKQSIFMWRDASPELFDGILEDKPLIRMVNDFNPEELGKNYRSAREIVSFNNTLFAPLKDPGKILKVLGEIRPGLEGNKDLIENIQRAFGGKGQETPPESSGAQGLVTVSGIAYTDGRKENAEFWENFKEPLLSFLKERLGGSLIPSDMMILVRRNEDANFLAACLSGEGIPVITENALALNEEPLVREACALLEFLENPDNDLAFSALINGEGFLACLKDMGGAVPDFSGLAPLNGGGRKPLAARFKESSPGLWDKFIEPFFKDSTLLPPYDVVREWFRAARLAERFPDRKMFLNSFLEYLSASELNGYNSISAFLEHWREEGHKSKAAMPGSVNAVKITTIHKAKGLEAPVVIVPLPNKLLRASSNYSDKRIRLDIDGMILNTRLLGIFKEEADKALAREAQEILNLLYVAFTRAKKELHVYTSVKAQAEGKKAPDKKDAEAAGAVPGVLGSLMEAAGLSFPLKMGEEWAGGPNAAIEEEVLEEPVLEEAREFFPWKNKLKIAQGALFPEGGAAARRGSFIHFCLENMPDGESAEESAKKALEFALSHSGIELGEGEAAEILEGLVWFMSQKGARGWIRKGWPEHAMIDSEGMERRADLIVSQDWGALVLDYKSGGFSEKNTEQMRGYLKCVKESGEFPGRILGLLAYIDHKKFVPVSLEKTGEPVDEAPAMPFM